MKVNVGSRKKRGQKKEERARALLPKKVAAALLDCEKGIPIKGRNPGRAAGLKHLQFAILRVSSSGLSIRGKMRFSTQFGPGGAVPFASRFTFLNDKTR